MPLCHVAFVLSCERVLALETVHVSNSDVLALFLLCVTHTQAHNFVWLADDELLSTVYSRCKPHLPAVDSTAVTPSVTAAATPSHSTSNDTTTTAAADTTTATTASRKRQRVETAADVNGSVTASDVPKRSGQLAGLNSRWRLYRYKPGSIYRPHIDGAWPASGVNADTGEYMYDAYGDRWSRL
jgi:hypothetical protein